MIRTKKITGFAKNFLFQLTIKEVCVFFLHTHQLLFGRFIFLNLSVKMFLFKKFFIFFFYFNFFYLKSFLCYSSQISPSQPSQLSQSQTTSQSQSQTQSSQTNIQLAFGIMIYQKPNQSINQIIEIFKYLYSLIYSPNKHIYIIHLDIKSDPIIHHEINKICLESNKNCIKIYSRNIAWGSLSTAEMMLALMQEAYESEISWDYFILLGHESLPIINLNKIEEILESYPIGTNFINCWNVEGYDFFGQYENNYNRLAEVYVDNFSGSLISTNGITRTPPSDIIFYKSLQQMILSSEFVHYAIYGPLTKRIMLYLANVKTSDEMLFPTILQVNFYPYLFIFIYLLLFLS